MKNIQKDILDQITPDLQREMEHIHFIADLHSGHNKIISICSRPVAAKDHNEWLVKEVFNKYVGRKDEVYILGDVSMEKRSEAEKFIDRLNGNKHLITGNHDKNLKNSTRFSEITQIKDFTFSRENLNIHIVLCHYPISSWNRKIHGSWHLYGHVHGRFENSGLSWDVGIDNKNMVGPRNINNWCKPMNLYEVCQIMSIKQQKLLQTEKNEFDSSGEI